MVAPSIDPDLEPKEPWRKFLRWPVVRSLIPTAIRVSNEEIYFLKQQLIEMIPDWNGITKPVVIVQGGDDFLVHPGNKDFALKMLQNTEVKVVYNEQADHFIPWTSPDMVMEALKFLE